MFKWLTSGDYMLIGSWIGIIGFLFLYVIKGVKNENK